MSRFNPARSSFISRGSSHLDMDSSSINESKNNSNSNAESKNDNNFVDESSDEKDSLSSFQRRNSSRFRSSMYNKSFRRPVPDQQFKESEKDAENNSNTSGLHIAPLLPFKTTSTPTVVNKNNSNNKKDLTSSNHQPKERVKSVTKSEENKAKTKKSSEFSTNDFDSMFSTEKPSFEQSNLPNKSHSKANKNKSKESDSSGIDSFFHELTTNKTVDENVTNSNYFVDSKTRSANSPKTVDKMPEHSENQNGKEKINRHEDDEEDEHIDWASSEDEEAVQKEIESFEKNKVSKRFFSNDCLK